MNYLREEVSLAGAADKTEAKHLRYWQKLQFVEKGLDYLGTQINATQTQWKISKGAQELKISFWLEQMIHMYIYVHIYVIYNVIVERMNISKKM